MSGASMSMMWMRAPGQSWPGAALAFLGTWVAMTAAMMLPAIAPTLWRYRRAVSESDATRRVALVALVGAGYLAVWMLVGIALFPVGATLATFAMHEPMLSRVAPVLSGVLVTIAGAWQLSAWKARHLARCRCMPECGDAASTDVAAAWRRGMQLGLHCLRCCANLMAISLVGAMDLRVMIVVGALIAAERLAAAGARVARRTGVGLIATGLLLTVRAVALR